VHHDGTSVEDNGSVTHATRPRPGDKLRHRIMPAMWNALVDAARRSPPAAAFVLGSGLGPIVQRVRAECRVGVADVPGLVAPSVQGHGGELILGEWAGRRVLVFSGRLHFYEGHSRERVAAPVRLAHQLGARELVLTNASGGIRSDLVPGTLMALTDHLAW